MENRFEDYEPIEEILGGTVARGKAFDLMSESRKRIKTLRQLLSVAQIVRQLYARYWLLLLA